MQCDCCKATIWAPEEHDQKPSVIQAEESERVRREEAEEEEGPPEIHDSGLAEIKKAEEEERKRRLREDDTRSIEGIDKLFSIYKFQKNL